MSFDCFLACYAAKRMNSTLYRETTLPKTSIWVFFQLLYCKRQKKRKKNAYKNPPYEKENVSFECFEILTYKNAKMHRKYP